MTATLVVSLLGAWLVGSALVMLGWRGDRNWRTDAALMLPLGLIVGLGVTSALFFAASLVSARPAWLAAGAEMLVVGGAAWRLAHGPRRMSATESPAPGGMTWVNWLLATLFFQAVVAAAVVTWRSYSVEPYGGWDGWAIWNLHARVMLRAGTGWPAVLAAPQLSWTHPDYPWLVPASVARTWAWAGGETPVAAAGVSVAFAAATAALLVTVVARLRGRTPALLAGLILIGTPFFVTFAANEHADIPLASLMLATVALLALGGMPALAGLCAGLAAWTKNEGLLFAVIVAICVLVRAARMNTWRPSVPFFAGLAMALVPTIAFKLALAPTNDLLAAPLAPRFAHVFDAARHGLILSSWWRDLGRFGEWTALPYLAMALPFAAWELRQRLHDAERLLPFIVTAMLAGYYGVYVLSPQDLAWHLDTSLVRLLLQLWPLALLWWALALPAWPEGEPARADQRLTRRVFLVVNTAVALAIVAAFSGQLAADELVVNRPRGVAVATGDGWFGVEQQGRQRWAWSKGNATLRVESLGAKRRDPVSLLFTLRSLNPRRVEIHAGDQLLWQGVVARDYVPVALRGVALGTAGLDLDFTTDVPGTPESPDRDARPLAFAIYDVRIE